MLNARYVVCIRNEGYAASLDIRKIYRVVEDREASERGLLRVVDETGEDYLFPGEFFMPIELTEAVRKALGAAR